MRALFRLRTQRRFSWLLWLALTIPLAQTAAARHLLAHPAADTVAAQAGKKPAVHQLSCELCLAAAALGSGAPAHEAPSPFAFAPADVPPAAALPDVHIALPVRLYQSRAPPLVLR